MITWQNFLTKTHKILKRKNANFSQIMQSKALVILYSLSAFAMD
jgi:hypothetical protein